MGVVKTSNLKLQQALNRQVEGRGVYRDDD